MAKHYDSQPKRIRLVSRGNILRDDAQALGARGRPPEGQAHGRRHEGRDAVLQGAEVTWF